MQAYFIHSLMVSKFHNLQLNFCFHLEYISLSNIAGFYVILDRNCTKSRKTFV